MTGIRKRHTIDSAKKFGDSEYYNAGSLMQDALAHEDVALDQDSGAVDTSAHCRGFG